MRVAAYWMVASQRDPALDGQGVLHHPQAEGGYSRHLYGRRVRPLNGAWLAMALTVGEQ